MSLSSTASAEKVTFSDLKTNWAATLGGAVTTIAVHELGHFLVAEVEGAHAYFDGVTVKYKNTDDTDSQNLRLSSAGFQSQWLVSEYAFMNLDQSELDKRARAYNAGLVLGHLGITAAYLTFLKNNDDGDARGIAEVTTLSTDKVIALLAIPALLDSWRLFGKHSPRWTSWTSKGFKTIGLSAIWTF